MIEQVNERSTEHETEGFSFESSILMVAYPRFL